MPLLRCQKPPWKSVSLCLVLSSCSEELEVMIFFTHPSLDPLSRRDGTLFSWTLLLFYSCHTIDQGNASAWTCWCYEFADLYLREGCQLTSESSGWLTSANTQNAEGSGQPCDKQGCFQMCLWLLFQPFLSWFSSFTVVFLIFLETSLCTAREFESHIPLLIIRNRQNCFFSFAVERWTWIQILTSKRRACLISILL